MNTIQDRSHTSVNEGGNRNNESIALAILDLPIGSVINIDGTPIVLQRDDFVGIHSIPVKTAPISYNHHANKTTVNDSMFHFVSISGGNVKANIGSGTSATTNTTVGFVLLVTHDKDDPIVARRYDPTTEEVSSSPIDNMTISNLIEKVRSNQIDQRRIICYRDIISQANEEVWYDLTNFIAVVAKFRKLQNGDKVVPGAYELDDDNNDIGTRQKSTENCSVDGTSIIYPPIPVFARDIYTTHFPSHVEAASTFRHVGTRRFLQLLNPSLRTSFCLEVNGVNSANKALNFIIDTTYERKWEHLLGDIQLSFILFLHLHCYTSYTFWRDAIAMISVVDATAMKQHMTMYDALFHTLSVQIQSMDNDEGLFSDIDMSDDDFFLLPSLEQLLSTASNVGFTTSLQTLQAAVKVKFSSRIVETDKNNSANSDLVPMDGDHDDICGSVDINDDNDDDDDDLPVIVSSEEIELSLLRSQEHVNELKRYYHSPQSTATMEHHDRERLRQHYPLLLAAMDSSSGKEDILMTCARVLYDAVDVSVVREAAAYLEDIERKKTGNGNVL